MAAKEWGIRTHDERRDADPVAAGHTGPIEKDWCQSSRREGPMEKSVEILAIVMFAVIGVSHVVQPRAWAEYFIFIRGKRETGAFLDGFLYLPLAALIIGFHNVWSGIPTVLTVLGWLFLIKSILRFCLP